MLPLNELAVFVAVVEAGSLSAAARRLELSKAAVSDQIRRLEERLGVRLLNRTTRRLSLTEAGRGCLDHARAMVTAAEAASAAATELHREPRGLLRVAAPTTFAPRHLVPHLPAFLAAHPLLHLELSLSARAVDLLEEGFDLAIRIGRLPDSALTARPLASARLLFCAAPSYLERRGQPVAPAALPEHDLLGFTPLGRRGAWHLQGPGRASRTLDFEPLFASDDGEALLAATLAGLGIAALPDWMVAAEIGLGRLQRVLPDWNGPTMPITALHAAGRRPAAKIRTFLDFLVERLSGDDWRL